MALKDLYSIIGQRIRDCRDRLELTQADLSRHTGINRATLSNIESGKQQVSLHSLYLIAEALQKEVSYFLPTVKEINILTEEHRDYLAEKMEEQNLDDLTKNTILHLLNKKSGNDK